MSHWDYRFLELAETVATWSKDPSSQVGCVLVNDFKQVVGLGYNGFPRGVADTAERYNDRPTKYLMVQHAEVNAVLNAVASARGTTAYVTHFCCSSCAGVLIQSGIKQVVIRTPEPAFAERFADSFRASHTMFDEAGVTVTFI